MNAGTRLRRSTRVPQREERRARLVSVWGGPRLVLLLTLVLLPGGAQPVAAQEAPLAVPPTTALRARADPTRRGQVAAPVELDGRTLFRIRGARSYPAGERARAISARLA